MDDIVNHESCHQGFYPLKIMLVLKTEGKKEFTILQTHTGSKTRSQFVTQPDDNKPQQEFKAQGRENWLLTFKIFCFPKIAARK
jgi:hypothetical protein